MSKLCQKNLSQLNLQEWAEGQSHQKKLPPQEKTVASAVVHVCPWCKREFHTKDHRRRFCSRSCASRNRQFIHKKSIEDRLWPRLKIADNGCWEWTGGKDKDGYGSLRWNNEQRTHRIAWILTMGEIPKGKWVLHKCDNPPCCNPFHLFLGNALDNNRDMISKSRFYYPEGELSNKSRLTNEDVIRIRQLHADGVQQRQIAKQFCVGYKAISKIVLRQRWKHI